MFNAIKTDLPASIIVFFVALPLCLGIALASGAPLFSGIIAGIIGGIVVGIASGSALGVSGPAAGLAVIVFAAIESLGSWEAFLLAVMLAGVIQFVMGTIKAGFIAYFFPSSVIKGMLTGIGLSILLKQIPHALGYDRDEEGDLSFAQIDGENTFTSIISALEYFSPGAILISAISLPLLILWNTVLIHKHRLFQIIQGPVVVVILGILINLAYQGQLVNFELSADHVVNIPVPENLSGFLNQFTLPDFSLIGNIEIWKIALTMAIIASLETLLCVEATDKLDPDKRITPTNRELKAQGLGNILSGLIGGLPITQVIVRSSANIAFGAKTKLSSILHGVFLLLSVITIAPILNKVPLASLATILMVVGYKLAKPSLFKQMYQLGSEQFIPFIATALGILLSDLLIGISIGLFLGVFHTLYHSYCNSHYMKDTVTSESGVETHHLVLAEEVSFFNKASILNTLNNIPKNSRVIIDCSHTKSMSYDVVEIIKNYEHHAKTQNITIEKIHFMD